MKLVYTHDNSTLVGLARSMLENAGLEVTVRNKYTGGGLPYFNQEIWLLDDSDYDQAMEVLENLVEEEGG